MPVLNSNNFQKKFNELLEEVFKKCNECKKCKENKGECEKIEKPSEKLLNEAAHFVNDMRLLKNLINEFKINWKIIKIQNNNLEIDKFFAMLLIKNFMPKEYDKLLKNEGSIYKLINKIKNYKFNIQNECENELEKINQKKIWWTQSEYDNKIDYLYKIFPHNTTSIKLENQKIENYYDFQYFLNKWSANKYQKKNLHFNNSYYKFDFYQFIDYLTKNYDEYKEKNRDILNSINKIELVLGFDTKISDLKLKIKECSTMTFNKTIEKLKSKDFKTSLDNPLNNIDDLTKTLILEGFLDDTYSDYI